MSSTESHSPPSSPANIFFALAKLVGNYSHSCMLLLRYADPKGRSTLYNGTQKFPPRDKEGHQTSWNLIPVLKSQMPCVCAAQGCHPSQAGLHWFAMNLLLRGDNPGCDIHLSHRQDTGIPCLRRMHLSILKATSLHQDTDHRWAREHEAFWRCNGSHKEDSCQKQDGSCQSNSCLQPVPWPSSEESQERAKQGAGHQPVKLSWQACGKDLVIN